jgi:PadR family transcriptional regulator, regulatory protein PadR
MTKDVLGEFEHQVLLIALRLDGAGYSVAIVRELEERIGREVSAAAVYIALRRLEENGLVRSRTTSGGGSHRVRRYFTVTERGVRLARESRRRFLELWRGLEPRLGGSR